MTTPQDTEQYIRRAAVDAEGNRIGKITKVYLDDQTRQPEWILVETGLFGTRQSFAPIRGSRFDGEQLVVLAVTKDQVKDALTSTRTRASAKAKRTPSASITAPDSAPPGRPAITPKAGRPDTRPAAAKAQRESRQVIVGRIRSGQPGVEPQARDRPAVAGPGTSRDPVRTPGSSPATSTTSAPSPPDRGNGRPPARP